METPVVERERARVAFGVAMMQTRGRFHGLPEIDDAANAEGHVVVLPFAPTEPASDALRQMSRCEAEYVIVATRLGTHTEAWMMKRSDGTRPLAIISESATVADWFRQMHHEGDMSYGAGNAWRPVAVSA